MNVEYVVAQDILTQYITVAMEKLQIVEVIWSNSCYH